MLLDRRGSNPRPPDHQSDNTIKYRLYNHSKKEDNIPCKVWRHWPVVISQTFTVESALPETRILSFNSSPLVNDWWPTRVWRQFPVSTSHTRIDVSREPLTIWFPSNWIEKAEFKYMQYAMKEQDHYIICWQSRPISTRVQLFKALLA